MWVTLLPVMILNGSARNPGKCPKAFPHSDLITTSVRLAKNVCQMKVFSLDLSFICDSTLCVEDEMAD